MQWVLVDIVISAVVLLAVNLLEREAKAYGEKSAHEPGSKCDKRFDGFTLHAAFTAGDHRPSGRVRLRQKHDPALRAGIVRPDEGRIVLEGRVLFDSAQGIDLPPQQHNVGLLFQNYALFPNMTVEQNILCALKKEKDPAARRAPVPRHCGHAAGGTGQAPARCAFGRAAAWR